MAIGQLKLKTFNDNPLLFYCFQIICVMRLFKNQIVLSLLYLFFFVFQQVWSYSGGALNIHEEYWRIIVSMLALVSFSIIIKADKSYRLPLLYTIVLVIGAFVSSLNGYSFGFCLLRALFAIMALASLVFVHKYKINLKFFDLLLIGLYFYYYYSYFTNLQFEANKNVYDGDVFETSSSNAIAICLNCVVFLYFVLNKYYKQTNQLRILLFSCFNMFLIVIQESRAGIVVGILNIALVLYDLITERSSYKKYLLSIPLFAVIIAVVLSFADVISNYFEIIGLSTNSYETNVRHFAQASFFHDMNIQSFLIGYGKGTFFSGLDRTFNSYLDLWNRYGFFSFCFFLYLFVRRFRLRKQYSIPFFYFLPVMVYAFVESLFAGSLWDMFFMYMLFLSDQSFQNIPVKGSVPKFA